jgi:hypothetical protein
MAEGVVIWLSLHTPNAHAGRGAQLIEEAERRGQAGMVERARVKAREAGHLNTTSLSCVVDLGYIPDGLDAAGARECYRETDSDIAAYRSLVCRGL